MLQILVLFFPTIVYVYILQFDNFIYLSFGDSIYSCIQSLHQNVEDFSKKSYTEDLYINELQLFAVAFIL